MQSAVLSDDRDERNVSLTNILLLTKGGYYREGNR